MQTKIYLGDSVYCEFDGYAFVLTTDNGMGPSNTIVLEPDLIDSLNRFRVAITASLQPPTTPKT